MSTTYRCPAEICAKFKGNEDAKREARMASIKWLMEQPVKPGDTVMMPNAMTGRLEQWGMLTTPSQQ